MSVDYIEEWANENIRDSDVGDEILLVALRLDALFKNLNLAESMQDYEHLVAIAAEHIFQKDDLDGAAEIKDHLRESGAYWRNMRSKKVSKSCQDDIRAKVAYCYSVIIQVEKQLDWESQI